MNIRQYQAIYLCPLCNGEDQSFSSGQGDLACIMFCHNCGHSIGNVIPGITAYGIMNPRVQIVTGRYVRSGGKPPALKTREQVQQERIQREEEKQKAVEQLDRQKKVKDYVAMMGIMDVIKVPEETRWDEIG
jgi:hypothetical protein